MRNKLYIYVYILEGFWINLKVCEMFIHDSLNISFSMSVLIAKLWTLFSLYALLGHYATYSKKKIATSMILTLVRFPHTYFTEYSFRLTQGNLIYENCLKLHFTRIKKTAIGIIREQWFRLVASIYYYVPLVKDVICIFLIMSMRRYKV